MYSLSAVESDFNAWLNREGNSCRDDDIVGSAKDISSRPGLALRYLATDVNGLSWLDRTYFDENLVGQTQIVGNTKNGNIVSGDGIEVADIAIAGRTPVVDAIALKIPLIGHDCAI